MNQWERVGAVITQWGESWGRNDQVGESWCHNDSVDYALPTGELDISGYS